MKGKENIYYRVGKLETNDGLWYNQQGEFTGLIHSRYDFCKANILPMEFDPEIVGYISATKTLEELFQWFPKEDIARLQKEGYAILKYMANDVKFYDKYQHLVIKNAELISTITID